MSTNHAVSASTTAATAAVNASSIGDADAEPRISDIIAGLLLLSSLILLLIEYCFNRADKKKSILDIESYVNSKIELDSEDKKLSKLMESVIPKHLAGKMRDDILSCKDENSNFYPIYLTYYDNVSILFADIVGFTKISSTCSAQILVETLNELFGRFDKAADKRQCLRIKILGDCYYCVSGIPNQNQDHASQCVEMGLDMIEILDDLSKGGEGAQQGVNLKMRVGIHTGRVLCGILGKKKWQFDVHSKDVELANHMEQSGEPGRVHISESTERALAGRYELEPAHGRLRDTYVAGRNEATYFVVTPPERRRNSLSVASGAGNQIARRAAAATTEPVAAVPAQQVIGAYGATEQAALAPSVARAGAARNVRRFKQTTQRIINALHFIRTIDAPFANFDFRPSASTVAEMTRDAMKARSQTNEINKFSLRFKKPDLARLYLEETGYKRLLRSMVLCLGALVCLLAVIHGEALDVSKTEHAPPVGQMNSTASNEQAGPGLWHDQLAWLGREKALHSKLISAVFVLLFLLVSLVHLHQVELSSRRDFIWRRKALDDCQQMAIMRDCNKSIFFNLLPPHVADYFLQRRKIGHMDLYHQSYNLIGVMFATVSNFGSFYEEDYVNEHGLGCLRLLNEIIGDFDLLLEKEYFNAIDKIKTIGSTYMAAIGLFPEHKLPVIARDNVELDAQQRKEIANYLIILINYAYAMQRCLEDINENSYNNFTLRVGMSLGPVTAGVIGATKPQYDIWGNTVNVASRMESTCEANHIQVTEEVYSYLEHDESLEFTCRGKINVKGKGVMTTYYVKVLKMMESMKQDLGKRWAPS